MGDRNRFISIRTCNDIEGGPELNLEITTHFKYIWNFIPDVLESYHDVCSCVNVPKYVHFMGNWSIDNHHNRLFAYFEPNCATNFSSALFIEAGHWPKSRDMHTHTRKYGENILKIHSFGPDPSSEYYSLSCSAYKHDKIMKLELFETLNKSSPEISANFIEPLKVSSSRKDDYNLINFFVRDNFKGM